jgi:hypothetical protein
MRVALNTHTGEWLATDAAATHEVPDDEFYKVVAAHAALNAIEDRWQRECRLVGDDPLDAILTLVEHGGEKADSLVPAATVEIEPEPVQRQNIPRNCTINRGGYHLPLRYGQLDDTATTRNVMAWCKCGFIFEKVKCPHPHQSPNIDRAGNVRCAWCNGIIIGNTGAEEITTQNVQGKDPRNVDIDRWKGDVG